MSIRNVRPIEPPRGPQEAPAYGMAGGFSSDLTPAELELGTSPDLNAVRFQANSVRKDFGFRRIGSPAISRILGLVEHKFIRDGSVFHRLCRLRASDFPKLVLEVWDGSSWIFVGETEEDTTALLYSTLSIQGVLLMADGGHIWIWEETFAVVQRGQDFPSGNLVNVVGDTVTLNLERGNLVDGQLRVNFSVTFRGASENGLSATIGLLWNGGHIASQVLTGDASSDPEFVQTVEGHFIVAREFEEGDEIALRLNSAVTGGGTENESITLIPSGNEAEGTKAQEAEAIGNSYTFSYGITFDGNCNVFFTVIPPGGAEESVGQKQYTGSLGSNTISDTFTFVRSGLTAGTVFRMLVVGPGLNIVDFAEVFWVAEVPSDAEGDVELKGYNREDDYDPRPGVEYGVLEGAQSVIEIVSPDAPGARFIAEFADRVVALQDRGDTQSFAWSASGNVRDWIGAGSGQLFLVTGSTDPIDDLMSFATLSSNVGALFRKRSIMRVFPTGVIQQALGVVKWIEGIGTESPFSVRNVEQGVIFLGHNLMVYFLSEQGLRAVGTPIQQELIRTVTSNLDKVDASWDSVFNEYILGVPEGNSDSITKLWYFDVRRFLDKGELIWRSRELSVQRLAVASTV